MVFRTFTETVIRFCITLFDMLDEYVRRNPIIKFVLENSLLSYAQADTILIDRKVKKSIRAKALLRDNKPVKKGSFVRSLKQCEENITKACYTFILLSCLDIIDEKTISGLVKIGKMLKDLPEELSIEQVEQLKVILRDAIKKVLRVAKE